MRYLKKFILVGFIASVLVLSFSFSASAAEFSPLPNPSYSGKESDGVYYFNTPSLNLNYSYSVGFLYGSSYDSLEYYYIDFNLSSSYNISDFVFSPAIVKNSSHFWLGVAVTCNSYSGTSWSNLFSGYPNRVGYSQSGTLISSSSMRYFAFYSGRYIFADLVDLGTTIPDSFVFTPVNGVNGVILSSPLSSGLTVYTVNSSRSSVTTYSMPVLPVEVSYYFNDGFTNVVGDIDSVYALIGSGVLEPVYDDNGNIVNYNITQNFDLGLNDSPVPDPWGSDFPDPEKDLLDQLPGINSSDVSSINSNLSSNSLNSSSIQWLYARFEDVTSNNKFRAVMLTMLSISVIAFTLNKRGVL